MDNEKQNKDFELDWIYAQYEEGVNVAAIAKELGKSEAYIYAHMKKRPEEYEDVKRILEEKYNRIIRRVRGLADKITLEYLEELKKTIDNNDLTPKDGIKAFCEMDKVLRIAKQYSDRVLLTEGKATENIGVGGMPLTMIVRKTYPSKEAAENACDD